tara:strand:- start:210 stop:1448 length:1239 start_codon:yes stop_codon:yes gene_type:complete
VAFDLLRRVLTHNGYTVNHIQNITDIDDKIIQRANDTNTPWETITDTYITSTTNSLKQLNILAPSQMPKATDHIPDMIQLIQQLIQNQAAYVANNAVYFRVAACPDYGTLSQKAVHEQQAGHRVDVESHKESPMDFILWKPSKPNEPSWESPWGPGRPGWHTECVAMIHRLCGKKIDIHGGGADLQFPHHENERAQACCGFNSELAHTWVHNGFVTVNNEKMSKSLNNFFTLTDVLTTVPADALRFFLMRSHYRAPLNYSMDALNDAQTAYQKLTHVLTTPNDALINKEDQSIFDAHQTAFWDALNNDMNTSAAIAELFALSHTVKQTGCGLSLYKQLGQSIGLFFTPKNTQAPSPTPRHIQDLAERRWEAKKAKDYATADSLRNEIIIAGYNVMDTPTGFSITPANKTTSL